MGRLTNGQTFRANTVCLPYYLRRHKYWKSPASWNTIFIKSSHDDCVFSFGWDTFLHHWGKLVVLLNIKNIYDSKFKKSVLNSNGKMLAVCASLMFQQLCLWLPAYLTLPVVHNNNLQTKQQNHLLICSISYIKNNFPDNWDKDITDPPTQTYSRVQGEWHTMKSHYDKPD